MSVEKMQDVGPSRIEIAYERLGDPQLPPVLLVMGAGAQLIHWPDGFCAELVARGLQVIRFDNRDTGLSTHITDGPTPDLAAALGGDASSASYTLSDMAADAIGLLDGLELESAHVVGASLGGMIAQTMAIEHPGRVRSLTSIMSTTGDPTVGRPDLQALAGLGLQPAGRQECIDWSVRAFRVVGSPGFPFDEGALRERSGRAWDRDHDPLTFARHVLAAMASGDRTARLRSLAVPALVIHGADDRMCALSGGQAPADAIPGAELVVINGMGHDLPRALWPDLASRIAALVERAEAGPEGG